MDRFEKKIGELLRGSGQTLAVAESCTGGRIAHLITTVPGSSEYFLGSVTSYAVPVKNKLLGVSLKTIEDSGIVSADVASCMAEGVRKLLGSTYSVATTGWADSYGDEREPAGTVWMAVSGPDGTQTRRFHAGETRVKNIELFTDAALEFLSEVISSSHSL